MKIYKIFLLLLLISIIFLSACFYLQKTNNPKNSLQPIEIQSIVNQPLFSFAVIGDPESDIENLNKALVLSKEKQESFVVLVGDLTSTGTVKQLEAVKMALDSSGLKYYVIPGNHDLWYGREVCIEKKKENSLDTCTNTDTFNEVFENNFSNSISNNHNFLFLDNSDEWLGFGSQQLDWLNNQYNNITIQQFNNLAIIFLHIPLYYPGSTYIMGDKSAMVKSQANDLLNKLCQTKPMAVFYGHLHYAKNYEYSCKNGNKLAMMTVGSVNRNRNAQLPRFIKVDIFSDQSFKIEEIILP